MTGEQPETVEELIPQLAAKHILAIDEFAQRNYELSVARDVRENTRLALEAAQKAADEAERAVRQANDALQGAFALKVRQMAEAQG